MRRMRRHKQSVQVILPPQSPDKIDGGAISAANLARARGVGPPMLAMRYPGPGAGVGPPFGATLTLLPWLLEANGPQGVPPAVEWAPGGGARTF